MAAACDDFEAELANKLLGPAVAVLNNILAHEMPKSLGLCADAVDASLLPCEVVSAFPIEETGRDYSFRSSYVTHVDSVHISQLALQCEAPNGANISSGRRFFAEIDAKFDELAVAVLARVDFPKVTIDAPCTAGGNCVADEHNLGLHVSARVSCRSLSSFGLELDPDNGLSFSRAITVHVKPLPPIDITKVLKRSIVHKLAKKEFACPYGLETVCKLMCSSTLLEATTHEEQPRAVVMV